MAGSGEKYKIFAGSLPIDCTQEDLMIVFGTYGTPTDIHLMAGKSTSGQCCAFVVYENREAAENAIASLDGVYSMREDGTGPIRVSWARPQGGPGRPPMHMQSQAPMQQSMMQPMQGAPGGYAPPMANKLGSGAPGGMGPPMHMGGNGGHISGGGIPAPPPPDPSISRQKAKLFVGNLPADITQEAVSTVFSHYGTVTNIHIMLGKSRSGQACAFVEYAAPIEAETAVLTLHEKYEIRPGDGAILVKYANSGGGMRAAPY
mmetsp:Transcript_101375/g.295323  ORF Transcript_101375/g.295323 Transcript_101375/m.295323 type:complete len:260 (+) Transcript_101375:95-874(+)